MIRNDIRNICIIAHVDHGKTTLVDHLLKQSGLFGEHETVAERVMDSEDLEKERGITILAKNCSVDVKGVRINIVDTPGHADFGGEVERILGTVDGAVLLVDAAEGPLPQTRFVLERALKYGHKVILCINKVDRPELEGSERISEVVNEVFDLFVELGASDEQCEFPIVYATARDGWCTENLDDVPKHLSGEKSGTLEPLFDHIIDTIHGPDVDVEGEFKLQLSNIAWSNYVGQLSIGRIVSGKVTIGQQVFRKYYEDDGTVKAQKFQVSKLFRFEGMKQVEVNELTAGDIGVLAGCNDVRIGDTLTGSQDVEPFPKIEVQAPTIKMCFSINTGPMSGKEGEAIQSRKLGERLERECRANVAFSLEPGESTDQFYMCGRGELQFAILVEQMRREGLEFMIGRPIAQYQDKEDGLYEPIERAVLSLPEDHSGAVTEMFQNRKGLLDGYENQPGNRVKLTFNIPSRGLLGIRTHYLTLTRGEGLFSSELLGYEPFKGEMLGRQNGAIVVDRTGKTTDYALKTLEDRGVLFVAGGVEVYEGMIIGENNRENDINVNPTKEKKLTNVRASGSDGLTILQGVQEMPLEKCIEWIDDDEWIEITPQTIRLRKKTLASNMRSVIRSKKKK